MPKQGTEDLDFSGFPHNTVSTFHRTICLACVTDVFTKVLGLPAKKTAQEIRSYTPTVEELTSQTLVRPYFTPTEDAQHCPYCESSSRKHTRLTTYCIEGGRATDAARRKLLQSLPVSQGQFAVLEEKATHDVAFFTWLEKMAQLDPEEHSWLKAVTKAYLERVLPKVDWDEVFRETNAVRRSVRLEDGWEVDSKRLFLAPMLYWETAVVQYLVSRAHLGGGLTFEGRLTLPELVNRLRYSGYLRVTGIHAHNPGDVLEALTHHLAGGDGGVKMYYLVDRREFLEQLKELKIAEPKKAASRKAVSRKIAAVKTPPVKKKPVDAKKKMAKGVARKKSGA